MVKRIRVTCFAVLAALCLCLMAVSMAWADDALGDSDTPNKPATTASASSDGSSSAASIDTGKVVLSAESDAALIDGASYALDSFSRAQKGSNRDLDGAYAGYCYYVGSSTGNVSLVAGQQFVVVYVPADVAKSFGFNPNDAESCQQMQQYLTALDNLSASGGAQVSASQTWYYTTQQHYEVSGIAFDFDKEVKDGSFYTCVLGVDGSDVTDASNPAYAGLTHASFSRMVAPADVNIVAQPTPLEWLGTFLSTMDYSPLWVTLKTTGTAIIFIFILGLAAAYFSLRIPPRAQDIADSIFTIPMVLPPTVCGFLLLLAFGRNTGIGRWFIDIGFPLIFSWQATVIAAVVVAFPLMYRSARGAFENLDPNMLDAARTLGWSNKKIFLKLMLPLSWSSIAAGTVLAFARALGEFGATLFMAGNYAGVTRTVPIAIYFEWMNGNLDVAIFWTIVIIIFSFIVILFINLWSRRTTKYRRTSGE